MMAFYDRPTRCRQQRFITMFSPVSSYDDVSGDDADNGDGACGGGCWMVLMMKNDKYLNLVPITHYNVPR